MQPMVSIIVPIYNAEQYLRRCVDSILNQEYTDYELLLVNDGSTDASGDICEEYGDQDPRVIVIQKENTGVSDSRNRALDRARGKYLQFLDSDDWITPDATRLFVRAAEEYGCDMVISDFYRVVGERLSPKGDIEEEGVLTREEFAAHMMENPADFYYGVLWNKLYRRDIVEEHKLRMDTDISWCEDFMFNLEYIRYAKVFYALHAPIYYYVKRKGSLASQGINISKTVKMKLMMFEYYNNFYKHVLDEEDYEKNRLQVYHFLVDAAKDGFVFPASIPGNRRLGEERSSALQEVISDDGIIVDKYRDRKLLVPDGSHLVLAQRHTAKILLQPAGHAPPQMRVEIGGERSAAFVVFSVLNPRQKLHGALAAEIVQNRFRIRGTLIRMMLLHYQAVELRRGFLGDAADQTDVFMVQLFQRSFITVIILAN